MQNCSPFRSANIHLPLWGRGTAAFAVVDEVFLFPFRSAKHEAPVGRGKRLKAHGPAAASLSARQIFTFPFGEGGPPLLRWWMRCPLSPFPLGKPNGQRTPVPKPSSERKVAFSLENDGRSLR